MKKDKDLTSKIEKALKKKDWTQARALLERALHENANDHWVLTMLGLTHYEEKDYETALAYTRKALEIKPECPLVQFHLAGSLFMVNRHEEALRVWGDLLDREVESIALDECGEGMDWALQLLNDCHYRMGRCYQFVGDNHKAQLSYLKYLHNRGHGVGSIYDQRTAEECLAKVSS